MAEKILIVDDDLDTLRLVGMMLDRQGYKIVAASSGRQALSLAVSEKPDLILLDLMMPDMDGVEVAKQLRANPQTQGVLIIMFTAKTQTEDKLEGFDAGADDYITKPAQPRELIAHVRAVLNRSRQAPGGVAVSSKSLTERGKVIGVLAAKGGLGVSTVALNLGVVLHDKFKKQVIVADYRPGFGTIGLELGYSNSQGLNRLLAVPSSQIRLQDVEAELILHSNGMRFMLASPISQDARQPGTVESFVAITDHLAHLAPVIVLDLGAAITPVIDRLSEDCSMLILVLEPVSQTLIQTRAMIEFFIEKGIKEERILLALVNRVRAGMQLSLSQVQDQLGISVGAIFTANPELAYQSSVENQPMVLKQSDGITTQQFEKLAEKVAQTLFKER